MTATLTSSIDAEGQKDAAMVVVGRDHILMTHDEATKVVKGSLELPKPYHVLGLKIPAYSHPRVQAAMLGLVLLMTVGMYGVIMSLGGAGQETAYLADVSNIALCAVFTVFCFVAPALLMYFGLRPMLCFGGVGYAAFAASLWCYNHTGNTGFVIFGGAWNGLSAATLWQAVGTGVAAYAAEGLKGFYISIMWSILNVGALIGAAIPLGQNWNAGDNNGSRVNDGTYIGFFVLMICGSVIGLTLYPWQKMVREDGSRVTLGDHKTLKQELVSSYRVVMAHRWIVFFFPMSWAVNFYFIYQGNQYNGAVFTVRGRSLNALLNGLGAIIAPWVLWLITDKLPLQRRGRALAGAIYVFVLVNAIWIGGYFAMRETVMGLTEAERMDVFSPGYASHAFLYFMYGYLDATYNCFSYWFIGALSNEPTEIAVYAGIFRVLNSASLLAAYALNLDNYSKEFMFGCSWAFTAAGPVFVLPIIKYWMNDTNMVSASEVDLIDGTAVEEGEVSDLKHGAEVSVTTEKS
ncbi:hypothetical protein A1O3_06734 [Capronia epimyces CBS 606.96]|uniref:UNC93-like protein n=1 Tax=Capronia epimyces CBS 606.96 TaxID=1182542 RepID=W9XRT8_9EURO|nr:uncharacterized protein A1O3_06734 [Capronia epimyces CBS 606.96]EXJ82918.1 hypothetical protein A1O3_06734 [Capronia epimyces CBS 606.96]